MSSDLDASISDEEIRRRLTHEFKVQCGPVTPSTRRVLLKKLAKLEKDQSPSKSPGVAALDDSRRDATNGSADNSISQVDDSLIINGGSRRHENGGDEDELPTQRAVARDTFGETTRTPKKNSSPRRYSPRRKTNEEIEAIKAFNDANKLMKKKQQQQNKTPKSSSRNAVVNVVTLNDSSSSTSKLHQYSSESSESEDDNPVENTSPVSNTSHASSFLTSRVALPRIFTSDYSSKQMPLSRPPIRRTTIDTQAKTSSLLNYSDCESDAEELKNDKLCKMLLSHRPGLGRAASSTKKPSLFSKVKGLCFNLMQKLAPRTPIIIFVVIILFLFFRLDLWTITIAGVAICAPIAVYFYHRQTKKSASEEQNQVYDLVEKSIELLQSPDEPQSMPVNHIRDTLLSPSERISPKYRRVWAKVVNHIENSDSRVKVEYMKIDGEDFKAWKWIATNAGANYLLNDNEMDLDGNIVPCSQTQKIGGVEWQGQAFGSVLGSTKSSSSGSSASPSRTSGSTGQNESIAVSPAGSDAAHRSKSFSALTRFLKIRNIFEKEAHFLDPNWTKKIKNTILEKTAASSPTGVHDIVHIEVEDGPNEGLVYLKCATISAATNAFHALHGWWCEKKLVSVKFLREDRYYQRFPHAKRANTALEIEPIN